MDAMSSRFRNLKCSAGDFHLLIQDDITFIDPLISQGRWVVVTEKRGQFANSHVCATLVPSKTQQLLAHLRSAEVVWIGPKSWKRYKEQLIASEAVTVVVADEKITDAPLVVKPVQQKLQALYALLAQTPSLRLALRKALAGAAAIPATGEWLIDGPFDSSYSLAIVNREMGRALREQGCQVVWSDPELLSRPLNTTFLQHAEHSAVQTQPNPPLVHFRNNYPPHVDDMNGLLNLYLNYAWEESGFPAEWVEGFNIKLHGLTVVSDFVRNLLRNNGIRVPIQVTGNGVDHLYKSDQVCKTTSGASEPASEPFKFVHISSCFPRKGVDVLLHAWGEAFSVDDPVKLIIKTFHNPHNNVPQQLEALKQKAPHHAPVELIMEDWPEEKIRSLLQSANALVAPSRAEGFGMPLAEAMCYGVPVIATGWGGHTDFCDEKTAWLIDYHLAPARSHVSTSESVWAEPDAAHLAKLMREIANLPAAVRQAKVEKARARVLTRYQWQKLAKKTASFVQTLWHGPAFWPEPKILWVSTFNSRCGIAEYSRNLLKSFPKGQYHVLADEVSEPLEADPPYLSRLLTWSDADIEQIAQAAASFDAVFLQHHHAFYSLSTVSRLVARLKELDKQVYITFHNTHTPQMGGSFDQPGLHMADRLFVHSVADLNRLKQYGLVNNVALFPHGVYEHGVAPDKQDAHRRALGLQDKQVIASFGFLMPHKGIDILVRAFAELVKHRPALRLLLLNSYHPTSTSAQEKQKLDALISELGLSEYVIRRHEYLSEQEAIELLSLSDVVAFPYRHTQESASGAVRMAAAAGKPIVATPLPIFEDVASIVHFTTDMSVDALTQALLSVLDDVADKGAEQLAAPVREWAESRGWQRLSMRLWNLLQGLYLDKHLDSHQHETG